MGHLVKKALTAMLFAGGFTYGMATEQTRMVGGDLSLVPAYVTAGDSWKGHDKTSITTTAGMLSYVKSCGWNAVRVRLFVDPDTYDDSDPATCQNLTYVKALGKAVKDAGLSLLLDLHYSDTWADPETQKIPGGWSDHTESGLASSISSYTTSVLAEMVAYGATPDAIQIGNEITYGMLWTNSAGTIDWSDTSYGICSSWSSTYVSANWQRLAHFLNAGVTAARKVCPDAKIVIHTELGQLSTPTMYTNFYQYINNYSAYPVDYDIIGFSYYPYWHGTLSSLGTLLSSIQTAFPTKEIQLVETAWYHTQPSTSSSYTMSWAYSATGQYNFLTDLISTCSSYEHVTGIYYWQPEECGNGAKNNVSQVMNNWDNRGFWPNTYESGSHTMSSGKVSGKTVYPINVLQNFATTYDDSFTGKSSSDDSDDSDDGDDSGSSSGSSTPVLTEADWGFENGDLSVAWTTPNSAWTCTAQAMTQWVNSACAGSYYFNAWAGSAISTTGAFLQQSITNLPAGTYTVTAVVHAESSNIYLFANDSQTTATKNSTWANADAPLSVTGTVDASGTLEFGLGNSGSVSQGVSVYADVFTVTCDEVLTCSETPASVSEGYASYYNSAAALQADDQTTVWQVCSAGSGRLLLTSIENRQIPAGTAVILGGTANTAITLTAVSPISGLSGNLLRGVDEATTVASILSDNGESASYIYTLNVDANKENVGFYRMSTGRTLGAHRAYLLASDVQDASGSAMLRFTEAVETGETGIESVTDGAACQPVEVYDLLSRRMSALEPGRFYVSRGRKVVVR